MAEENAKKSEADAVDDDVRSSVGVFVSADVHITRYSALSLDDTEEPTVTIVTSLNAIIRDASTPNAESNLNKASEENQISKTGTDPPNDEEVFDQPYIRKSKKSTKLSNVANKDADINVNRVVIDRTILLPYLGCTAKQEYFQTPGTNVLVKLSKSCETLTTHMNKTKNTRELRSRSLTRTLWKKENNSRREVKDPDIPSFDEVSSIIVNNSSIKPLIGRHNYVKSSKSPLDDGEKHQNERIRGEIVVEGSSIQDDIPDNIVLKKNIEEFEREVFGQSLCSYPKKTRNVSILHRPRMRNQATSTSSLNKIEQDLDKSIKGFLMPYVAANKDFPSELVLNLVPKKEALELGKKDVKGNMDDNKNSQDVLTPVVNVGSYRKKKKKPSFFRNCFPLSKKNTGKRASEESMNKEVYYPSVVEVYDNKPRKSPQENDSDILSAKSSLNNGRRRKR